MNQNNHALSIVFGLILAVLILANQLDWRLPLAANDRLTLVVVGISGMALCSQGIGRIAANNHWLHPIGLLGMLIGLVILIVWGGRLLNLNLPVITSDSTAILAMGILMASKWGLARLYGLLA
jgi:hypothetical protein